MEPGSLRCRGGLSYAHPFSPSQHRQISSDSLSSVRPEERDVAGSIRRFRAERSRPHPDCGYLTDG